MTGAGSLEGDVRMPLLVIRRLRSDVTFTAVAPPSTAVWRELSALDGVRTIALDVGSREGPSSGRGRAYRARRSLTALGRLVSEVMRHRIDVIYTLDRTVGAHLAALTSAITRRPLVLSAHYPAYPRSGTWNRWTVRSARRVHVHSEYLADAYRTVVRSPRSLVEIPNAIDVDQYVPADPRPAVLEALGLTPTTPVVVMTGRLSPFKGQDDLIRATAILRQRCPAVRVLIAGNDTPEAIYTHGRQATHFRPILERLIDDLDLREHVTLLGYYPNLPELLASATVTAMPSWEEPFGLVALEAMAMMKPVVATNAGGVPEFIEHARTGFLVPPRDPEALAEALLDVIQNRDLARQVGAAARRRVEERHTAEQYVRRVAALFDDVALASGSHTVPTASSGA